jgi:hypothetical protein
MSPRTTKGLIGHGGEGGNQLDGGHGNPLSEGDIGCIDPRPFFHRPEKAAGLAGKIDTGLGAESEITDVIVKFLFSELLPHLDRADVARILQDVVEGQRFVALALRLVDHPVGDRVTTVFTVEDIRFLDNPLLQRGRRQKGLEGGSWIEGVCDGLVLPRRQVG